MFYHFVHIRQDYVADSMSTVGTRPDYDPLAIPPGRSYLTLDPAAPSAAGHIDGLGSTETGRPSMGWRLTFASAAATGLIIVTAQMVLVPGISADGRTGLRDLGGVFRIPSARTGLIATALVFIGHSIAVGSAIGDLLIDSAGLVTVHTAAGSIALASAVFALIVGHA
jgi:hypothetical protein